MTEQMTKETETCQTNFKRNKAGNNIQEFVDSLIGGGCCRIFTSQIMRKLGCCQKGEHCAKQIYDKEQKKGGKNFQGVIRFENT